MGVKEMTIRQHVPNNSLQHVNRALRQSAVKARQVQSSIFTRKKEHPHALDGKESEKGAVDLRGGAVAAESALFVLSIATATGALYAWDNAVAEKNELKAVKEQTPLTEAKIANANENQWTAAISFVATMALAAFFGLRVIRMLQAKFEKKDVAAA
jgi:hypothetical protein